MPQRIDALICPRWTIAIEPTVRAEEGLALAVLDGRILAVLPREEALARFEPVALHERPDHALLPGLVNAHGHAAMTLMRGFADDMPLERWLGEHIWPAEQRCVTPEWTRDGTSLAIAEMLRAGITCFADMYYFPDVVGETALEAGMRAVVGMIAVESPTVWAANADEYLSKGLAVHDRFRGSRLISTAFAPHAPYTVSETTLARIRQLSDELELPVQMHVHETQAEIAAALEKTGCRPLERLARLGLVTPNLLAVHATQLLDNEIERLAAAGAHVVHCPRSDMKLASGACRVHDLAMAGVNIALGTDGAASNNRLDLWAEIEAAALLGKLIAGDATAVPAADALRMATLNGAKALGLDGRIGSLVAGKEADMICVALTGPATAPVLDPVSQLVYSASREFVTDVWVAGEHLVAEARLTRLDADAICEAAARWGRHLLARNATH